MNVGRETGLFFLLSMQDQLSDDHLGRFVADVVDYLTRLNCHVPTQDEVRRFAILS